MSVGSKSLPARRADEGGESSDGAAVREEDGLPRGGGGSRNRKQKAARYGRCFSGLELSIGPAPLKDVDAGRLKDQIRRWAKAVVAFARQISFGSPRSVNKSSGGTTPRSSTFPAAPRSSRLGAAKNDEPPSDA
ncbi:uncharacterized protein LOC120675919 [Panicum virgatum]|uniref:Uncharacterized protein n=1 Tax=Panicum virgatum TaxID=38727 RepID=A0A8T0RXN7_PANVG|nr:uncharacterized protein LOC120675919 [Panicum virgatum]KAG2589386.1 hypothetical protein PVAP13_5NG237900 [Panicum virgatum]